MISFDTDEAAVLVCTVTFNSAAVLPDLLNSLAEGLRPFRWRLVVVDNASCDGSVEIVRTMMPDAIIVQTGRNAGYAAGINVGVATALRDEAAILVVNPDVRLGVGCVADLMGALREENTGIAVPRLEAEDGRLIHSMRREPTVLRALSDALIGARRAGKVPLLGEIDSRESAYAEPAMPDWAEGSTQLISVSCWKACGGWDESFFLYSEETEFALRARDRGYATHYVPQASAIHLEGDSGISPRLWPLVVSNRLRLYGRRHDPVKTAMFWGALVLREGTRALLGKATSRSALRVLLSPERLREEPSAEWLR